MAGLALSHGRALQDKIGERRVSPRNIYHSFEQRRGELALWFEITQICITILQLGTAASRRLSHEYSTPALSIPRGLARVLALLRLQPVRRLLISRFRELQEHF